MTMQPAHGGPWRLPYRQLLELALGLPGGQPRSLRGDVAAMVKQLPLPPLVQGLAHLPAHGPLVLAANHYERPGLWIGWAGATITWAAGQVRCEDPPVHWLVAADLRTANRGGAVPGTRWLFRRVAHTWGMVPLAQEPEAIASRAQAMRRLSSVLDDGEVVGLFPEGSAGRAGLPGSALPGAQSWLRRLALRGVPVVPVAVRECGATLGVAFGPPLTTESTDVMEAIRGLYITLGPR